MVIGPRADVPRRIRRHRVESGLEQDTFSQVLHLRRDALVRETDAAAEQVSTVKGNVARDVLNAIDADFVDKPLIEFPAAFDLRVLGVITPSLHMQLRWWLNSDIYVFRDPVDNPMPL